MRVTHIRPIPVDSPSVYRLGLLLHSRLDLDREHAAVDLRRLSRPEARELLHAIEARTGLVSRPVAIDARLEEDDD
jgi:hypothetical protein